jgi:hypothetical protein
MSKIVASYQKTASLLAQALPYCFIVAALLYLLDRFWFKVLPSLQSVALLCVCASMFIANGSNAYAQKINELHYTLSAKMKRRTLVRKVFFWVMTFFYCLAILNATFNEKHLASQTLMFLAAMSPAWALAHWMNVTSFYYDVKKQSHGRQKHS